MLDNDFDKKEQSLKQQLAQIELDKQIEANRIYQENTVALDNAKDAATAYRNQALKTTSQTDRIALYRLAEDSDQEVNRLSVELGLVSESDLETAYYDRINSERLTVTRQINALLLKSLAALILFMISDYVSGQIAEGFLSYVLKICSLILWPISVVFGGLWLVCSSLTVFIGEYGTNGINSDFKNLNPTARLAILVALLAAILHLLSAIIPNAN